MAHACSANIRAASFRPDTLLAHGRSLYDNTGIKDESRYEPEFVGPNVLHTLGGSPNSHMVFISLDPDFRAKIAFFRQACE